MGSGKSTLLAELRRRGFTVVPEPARIVLAEQRAAGGDGVLERSPQRFCDLMLERMKSDYDEHPSAFYDRGIPISSATRTFSVSSRLLWTTTATMTACSSSRRGARSTLRRTSSPKASAISKVILSSSSVIYEGLGYEIVDAPKDTPAARAHFIINA